MSMKGMNDTMGPNGLISSQLLFLSLSKFPSLSSISSNQLERFKALKLARTERETIVAESRIKI